MPFDPKDPETKAALEAAIEAALAPLEAKKNELLGEVKKLRKSAEITPEQLSEVEAERDRLSAELATANKAAKDHAKAADAAAKALQAESGFTQKLLVENGLTAELTKHGVTNPVHIKAAQAMLRQSVTIEADGENRVAKAGGKALGDFVKEWATGDEGKFFVTAPANSGGGAPGGAGKPAAKTINRAAFEALGPADRSAHFAGGGAVTD